MQFDKRQKPLKVLTGFYSSSHYKQFFKFKIYDLRKQRAVELITQKYQFTLKSYCATVAPILSIALIRIAPFGSIKTEISFPDKKLFGQPEYHTRLCW